MEREDRRYTPGVAATDALSTRQLRMRGAPYRELELEIAPAVVAGREALHEGGYGTVIGHLGPREEQLRGDPPTAPLLQAAGLTLLGRAKLGRGQDEQARPLLARAVALYSGAPDLTGGDEAEWGLALAGLGRHFEAIEAFRRAHRAGAPPSAEAAIAMAEALIALDQEEEAVQVLQDAAERGPAQSRTELRLAEVLHARGEDEPASAAYWRAALKLRDAGRFAEALKAVEAAVALGATDPYLLCLYAVLLNELDRNEEAAYRWILTTEADPTVSLAQFGAASTLAALGRINEALPYARRFVELEPDDVEAAVLLASLHWVSNELDATLAEANRALTIEPRSMPALKVKADVLIALGRDDEVEATVATALEIDPDDPYCLMLQGLLFARREQWTAALEHADAAIDAGLADVRALFLRGQALMGLGRIEEAVEALQAARAVAPDSPQILASLAMLLYQSGRGDEASETLDDALRLAPSDLVLREQKARLLVANGAFDGALSVVEAMLVDAPHYEPAIALKIELLRDAGRIDEALATADAVLEHEPAQSIILARKGDVLRIESRYDEALTVLREAVRLTPDDAFANGTMGGVLADMGRPDDALPRLERALELDPDYGFARITMGQVLIMLDRPAEALAALDQAVELDPGTALAHVSRAVALAQLDKPERGLDALERALELDPDNAYAMAVKGDILRTLDRLDEATAVLDHALAINDEYAFALGTKGGVLAQMGHSEQAATLLRRALSLDPDYIFARVALAQALQDQDLVTEALEHVEAALAITPDDLPALSLEAWLHYAIGEFAQARDLLHSIVKRPDAEPTMSALLCWTLLYMRGRLEEQAETAMRTAMSSPTSDPPAWWSTGLAEALRQRDPAQAREIWESVVDRARGQTVIEPVELAAIAWSHFRLDNGAKAARVYARAIAVDPDDISLQFDLALSLLASGHESEALREYGAAVERVARKPDRLRRRGLLLFAKLDLDDARSTMPAVRAAPAAVEAQGNITRALEDG